MAVGRAWPDWDGDCEAVIDTFWELSEQHF